MAWALSFSPRIEVSTSRKVESRRVRLFNYALAQLFSTAPLRERGSMTFCTETLTNLKLCAHFAGFPEKIVAQGHNLVESADWEVWRGRTFVGNVRFSSRLFLFEAAAITRCRIPAR